MQRHPIRVLVNTSVLLLAFGAGLAAVGSAYADPPPWAPAHGKRAKQHSYTYYPEYGFYYSPESRSWFWLEGSDWRVGVALPDDFQPFAKGGISIELGTERPYEENNLVVERYGKPKKINHDKKYK